VPGPLFWGVVYVGVLGASVLRRWSQARPSYGLGRAGWDENPAESDACRALELAKIGSAMVVVLVLGPPVLLIACCAGI
jgi:hypothetical protein